MQFLQARFEDLEPEGPFDAVIGSSVLHHLDLDEALARIATVLPSGGRFSFAEPNMLNPQIFAERHVDYVRKRLHVSPDETAFVRWTLARTLARAGFTDIRIVPFDWLHPFTPAPCIPIVQALGRCLEAIPFAREFSGSLQIACVRRS